MKNKKAKASIILDEIVGELEHLQSEMRNGEHGFVGIELRQAIAETKREAARALMILQK